MRRKLNIDLLLLHLENGSDDDPDAEWKAAIELGNVQTPEEKQRAVPALLEALSGGRTHALIRAHAAESLGRLGDRRAVAPLIAALHDPYRLVRAYAAGALGTLNDTSAIEHLLELLKTDEFFGVRAEAVKAATSLSRGQKDAQHVRDTLIQQRRAESARSEPGSERVLAEIDRALDILR